MKRIPLAITCVALLCLAVPAVASSAKLPESNQATETPREERARLVKETLAKLKQSNRTLLRKPATEPILLSDEEIMLLVPDMKAARKIDDDIEITNLQAILLMGPMFFRRVLREDGIFGQDDRLTSSEPTVKPGEKRLSYVNQIQGKLMRANRGLLQEPATAPIVLSDKEIKRLIPGMKATQKENFGTDLTDRQAILLMGQMSFLMVLAEEGIFFGKKQPQ